MVYLGPRDRAGSWAIEKVQEISSQGRRTPHDSSKQAVETVRGLQSVSAGILHRAIFTCANRRLAVRLVPYQEWFIYLAQLCEWHILTTRAPFMPFQVRLAPKWLMFIVWGARGTA
jgi:hypothetical protein